MSDLRKQHTLREFAKKIGQERAFLDFLRELQVPSIPMHSIGIKEKEKQEIRGFQRGADGIPYLPGSSVKGSIRTALLYHFLENYAEHDVVGRILRENLEQVRNEKYEAEKRRAKFNTTRHSKSFGDKIEYLAFFAEMVNERGKRSEKEAQDDLMRCLLVSDTLLTVDALSVENIDLYLVKKLPKGQGYEAQRQRQAPAVEAVIPNINIPVQVDFNTELLLHLHRHQGDTGIPVGREKHFIGWRARSKWLFNLDEADFSSVPKGAKSDHPAVQALRDKSLAHIIECCRRFTQAQAEALNHWKANFQKNDKGGMSRDLDAGTAPVLTATGARLHLGFATGFDGMTVVLHLLAKHKPLFADIMDVFGIGDSPVAWKTRRPGETYRSNPDKFPSSRRLATRTAAILPLGWLEWADDPNAGEIVAISTTTSITAEQPVGKPAPSGPQYLRGSLKVGAKLDAILVGAGNPGKFKLYIRPDHEPVLEVKYPAGFKEDDLGRLANILVKNLRGKDGVDKGDFGGFK
jgi:CRISPR/Cas system CSM-associated protein Csm5 (group 7 of RAMP superfamily)